MTRRSCWALAFSATIVLRVVVDQVDAGLAALEWRGREIVWVPVDVLPADVSEGDRLEIRVRRREARRDVPRRDRRREPATIEL